MSHGLELLCWGVVFMETDLRQETKQEQDLKPSGQCLVCVASPSPFSTRGGLSEVLQAAAACRDSQNSNLASAWEDWGCWGSGYMLHFQQLGFNFPCLP